MRAWKGSREPFTAVISRVKGTGCLVPRVVRSEVFPSRTMPSTLSITSSRAWGRLQGRRAPYCTRPPQLWRAPTMSWLRFRSMLRASFGFSRNTSSSLENSLTHQNRRSRRGRGSLPSLMRRVRARPISRRLPQPLPSSLAEVISSWMWAVRTICWSFDLGAPDPALDHGLLALLRPARVHLHLHLEGLRRRLAARGRGRDRAGARPPWRRCRGCRPSPRRCPSPRRRWPARPPGRGRPPPRAGWWRRRGPRGRRASRPPPGARSARCPRPRTTLPFTSLPA